ncbi:MAG: glutaredoxin domain-containing protein [bacterium]
MKKIIPIFVITAVLIGAGYIFARKSSNNSAAISEKNNSVSKASQEEIRIPDDVVLYFGSTCPHCKVVEKFIEENNINIQTKEIFQNKNNANELRQVAKICKIPDNEIGVPLLWTGTRCLSGDSDIINFLKP